MATIDVKAEAEAERIVAGITKCFQLVCDQYGDRPAEYKLFVAHDTLVAVISENITRVRDEEKRETVEKACAAVCDACDLQTPGVSHSVWCDRIRAAFAEPGKEQEPPTQRDLAAMLDAELEAPEQEPRDIGKEKDVPIVHGVNCLKVQHTRPHMHDPDDDSPYSVDDVWYCGRCHFAITPPAVPPDTLHKFAVRGCHSRTAGSSHGR